jgi:hypothetical protein
MVLQVADYSLQKAQWVALLLLRSYLGAAGSTRLPDRPSFLRRLTESRTVDRSKERDRPLI